MKKTNYLLNIIMFIIGIAFIIGAIIIAIFGIKGNQSLITVNGLSIVGLIICISGVVIKPKSSNESTLSVKELSMVGVQGAISVLLYIFVKFNLPIFPSFLDIQVSEIPALITSFAYGPVAGCLVLFVRFIVKLPMTGTAGVGELADLVISLVLVIISGLIYQRKRTLKGAIVGTGIGIIVAVVACCFVNWLVLIPFYLQLYFNGSMEGLLAMCSMIPGINEANFMPLYIFVGVIPFNLLRFVLVFIFTFLLYKRIHFLLKKITRTH